MTLTARDRAFLAFADRSRGLLLGCALLLVGDRDRAERLTETVLARRYAQPQTPEAAVVAALRELVRPQPAFFRPPWRRRTGLELVDDSAAPPTPPLLSDLQRLPADQRACVVLVHHAGLEPPVVAEVLGTDVDAVDQSLEQGARALVQARPDRGRPGRLSEELRSVTGVLEARDDQDAPAGDLQHGRLLFRRGQLRRVTALVAALLVLVVGSVGFLRSNEPVSRAGGASGPVPTSTPSPVPQVSAACEISNPSCQATVMREWRGEISRVAASYLDPEGTYFTGYSFSYDPRYETSSFWQGRGGALGLEMFRLTDGATEVYVQVATGYDAAVRCGRTTRQRCESLRFMNGNRFSVTATTEVGEGIEVQHRPESNRVVTAVARNTMGGRVLPVTSADLIALVQDPRLRLPSI